MTLNVPMQMGISIPDKVNLPMEEPNKHLTCASGRWVVIALKFKEFAVLEVSPFSFMKDAMDAFNLPFAAEWNAVDGKYCLYDWVCNYEGFHYECHWTVVR